ncbi:MAG: redoxin domain-containing protein [bacterium]|nr:redoxin domain-containing protein [bacterium]
MKKEKLKVLLLGLLAGGMIGSICLNIFLLDANTQVKAHLPYLLQGEAPEDIDLVSEDGKNVRLSDLESSASLIFIFRQPCSTCNKNLRIWNRIHKIVKENCNVYGIVLGELAKTVDVSERATFDIYVPADVPRFRESFRVKINLSQTIIFNAGKAAYVHLGELQSDDFTGIVRYIKALEEPET